MSLHKEMSFETEICDYLADHGWLYAEGDAACYDRVRQPILIGILLRGQNKDKPVMFDAVLISQMMVRPRQSDWYWARFPGQEWLNFPAASSFTAHPRP